MSSEEVKQETNNGQTNQQQPEEAKPVVEKKILCKYKSRLNFTNLCNLQITHCIFPCSH